MRKIFWLLIVILLIGMLPTAAQNNQERIVAQRFEQGEMIYRESNGDIFVLSSQTGHWWRYSSAQYGRLAANMRTNPPANRYSPINGFGRIWANFSTVRDEIGWGVLPEIGFETQVIVRGGEFYLYRLDGVFITCGRTGHGDLSSQCHPRRGQQPSTVLLFRHSAFHRELSSTSSGKLRAHNMP